MKKNPNPKKHFISFFSISLEGWSINGDMAVMFVFKLGALLPGVGSAGGITA